LHKELSLDANIDLDMTDDKRFGGATFWPQQGNISWDCFSLAPNNTVIGFATLLRSFAHPPLLLFAC